MIDIRQSFRTLFLGYSTRPLAFLLIVCAYSWTLVLIWPGESMNVPAYAFMRELGGDTFWAALFATYASLALWRLFGRTQPGIALLINLLGLALFCTTLTTVVSSGIRPIPAGWGLHFSMMFAAAWVFVRSRGEADMLEE